MELFHCEVSATPAEKYRHYWVLKMLVKLEEFFKRKKKLFPSCSYLVFLKLVFIVKAES